MLSKTNTTYTKYFLILVIAIFALTAVACTDTAVSTPTDANTAVTHPTLTETTTDLPAPVVNAVVDVVEETAVTTAQTIQTTGPLTADEIAGLLFMREEEKLARDVYLTLNEQWGMNIFNNIAASEQMHIDAVVNLLNVNNIPDPAANNGTGEFANQELQTLYDQLIATGSQSLADALKVGGAIEEIDIMDLDKRMNSTSNNSTFTKICAPAPKIICNPLPAPTNDKQAKPTNPNTWTSPATMPSSTTQTVAAMAMATTKTTAIAKAKATVKAKVKARDKVKVKVRAMVTGTAKAAAKVTTDR